MTETTQRVLQALKTHSRVLLVFRNGKETQMAKKKATKKAAKKSEKKVTMTKAQAVDAAVKAVEADKRKRAKKQGGRMSGLDASAKVLAEAGEALDCKTIVERALAKGYWATSGKTPASTVYAAILRECVAKKDQSRFRKAGPGKFELAK